MVPAKGVTIVLENRPDVHVVARPSRPCQSTAWYPRGRLAVCRTDVAVPFFGPPSVEALRSEATLGDRLRALREPAGAASYEADTRLQLEQPFGLERWIGRVDEAYPGAYPVRPRDALVHAIQHVTVPCDPVLARAALDHAKSDVGAASIDALEARALACWLDGEALEEVSIRLTALLTAPEELAVRSAFNLAARVLVLASLGRWTEAGALAKRGLALAKRQAARSDSKEAALGERYQNAFEIHLAFAATPDAPPSPALQTRLRREALLLLDVDVVEAVHWLRILHRHAGLSPREVLLTSYFELRYRNQTPVPPAALEAEVAALKARVGYTDPGPRWQPSWEASSAARDKKEKARAAKASPARAEPAKAESAKAEEPRPESRPYAIDEHFKVGEWIEHSKFGLGRVTSLPRPDAVQVAFVGGTRVLIHRP
jgi:hypothetical protein